MNYTAGGTEERLIEAAVQLFSTQGFSATSTREIARFADVNETSLFRYFPRKQDVFWAAMESRFRSVRIRRELQNALDDSRDPGDPAAVIPLIFEFLVHVATYQPELLRLLYVGLLELRPGAEKMYRAHLAPIFQSIHRYFERCVNAGALRKVDPWITTAAIASTVLADQQLFTLGSGSKRPYANSDEAVNAYTVFWLKLLQKDRETVPPDSRSTGDQDSSNPPNSEGEPQAQCL